MSELKAGVGLSRKWDAREAGREVAETALEKLDGEKPKFFLLFSTIHYEKYGGFQELLNGVWEVLPEGTPLIGGTVVGFMNGSGNFTRGVSSMALSYPDMDVSVGVGQDTKKNPEKAAKDCASMLQRGLHHSVFENQFVFQLVSGPTVPSFPGVGSSFVLNGKFKGSLATKLMETSTKKFQRGIGREEEVLYRMSKLFENSYIMSASSSDDMRLSRNYQFIGKKIYTNSIVALAVRSDVKLRLKYGHGFYKLSEEKLKITDATFGGKIIKKINGKDAIKEFIRKIGWFEDTLDERLHRKTFFFPLGWEYPDGTLAPAAIGAILGGGFSFSYGMNSKELYVLTATGESIINSMRKCVSKDAETAVGMCCCANLATIGKDIYLFQKETSEYLDDFLIIFTMGEGVYLPNESIPKFFNEATAILSLG